jgi:chromosome segregation ATPase
MADPVWGVKVSDDVKKKAAEIIERSGMDSKTWFEKVLEKAELDLLKEISKDYAKDLEELEIHTARIGKIFVNMINRATFEKENIKSQIEDIKTSKDQIITGLQQDLSAMRNRLIDHESLVKEALQDKNKVLEQSAKLQETNDSLKSLISEYKEKIDTFSGLVKEYRQFGEDNKVLKVDNSNLRQELNNKEHQIDTLQNSITNLHNKIAELEDKHEAELARQQKDYNTELERLAEKKDLEKDREIVNLQNQLQEKLFKATENFNNKLLVLYKELDGRETAKNKGAKD